MKGEVVQMNENNNQVTNSVYSDFTDVGFNLYNFTLYFGTLEDGKSQLLGKVKMSPETAKQFVNMLTKNLESYEKVYGKINEFTPEVAERERKMIEELNKLKEQKEAKKESANKK
jgi:hypothetical protein